MNPAAPACPPKLSKNFAEFSKPLIIEYPAGARQEVLSIPSICRIVPTTMGTFNFSTKLEAANPRIPCGQFSAKKN